MVRQGPAAAPGTSPSLMGAVGVATIRGVSTARDIRVSCAQTINHVRMRINRRFRFFSGTAFRIGLLRRRSGFDRLAVRVRPSPRGSKFPFEAIPFVFPKKQEGGICDCPPHTDHEPAPTGTAIASRYCYMQKAAVAACEQLRTSVSHRPAGTGPSPRRRWDGAAEPPSLPGSAVGPVLRAGPGKPPSGSPL